MAKLLLIEDEKILRENTSELLELHGHKCITARHGKEGLEIAIAEKPDLIICDILLPYYNGFQIKSKLNELYDFDQIPFIFLSAKTERSDLRKGMELGAADYITKPFKTIELINSINTRLTQTKNNQTLVDSKVIESIIGFIRVAEHECNTPLNAIINLSGLIIDKKSIKPALLEKSVKAINTSGKRLHKTLKNLIDLIRLKHFSASTNKPFPATDINIIIERTLSERLSWYNYTGELITNFNCTDGIEVMHEDVEIIVFEVLDNLFKFSTSSQVTITVNKKENDTKKWLVLTAINGLSAPISFDKNDIGPFKQYNRIKKEQQGCGLGLYLIQIIIEKYKGTMHIDSSNAGLFQVNITFPLSTI